jgi:hypothetical protein
MKPGACSNCFDIPCRCGKAYEDVSLNKLIQAKNAIERVIKKKEESLEKNVVHPLPEETMPTLNIMTKKLKEWRNRRNKSV